MGSSSKLLPWTSKKHLRDYFVGGSGSPRRSFVRSIVIANEQSNCLFDTGSPVAFIDYSLLKTHFSHLLPTIASHVSSFSIVSGSKFKSYSRCQIFVRYDGKSSNVDFYIVDTPMKLILGLDGLCALSVSFQFHPQKSISNSIAATITENDSFFS